MKSNESLGALLAYASSRRAALLVKRRSQILRCNAIGERILRLRPVREPTPQGALLTPGLLEFAEASDAEAQRLGDAIDVTSTWEGWAWVLKTRAANGLLLAEAWPSPLAKEAHLGFYAERFRHLHPRTIDTVVDALRAWQLSPNGVLTVGSLSGDRAPRTARRHLRSAQVAGALTLRRTSHGFQLRLDPALHQARRDFLRRRFNRLL